MENIRHSVLPNTKQVVNLLYHMERDWKTAVDINEQLYGIVLVIGNPGCGKTTLIKHLIGDSEKLIADLSTDTKTYSIIDKNSLVGKKMFSASGIPQIIEHQFELYIECPHFNDEGSLMSDVATSFAINSLIYNANSFKILFVCEHELMTAAAGYNSELWQLLHRTAKFMRNIESINSIGLIVTKVCVSSKKPVPDDTIIEQLVSALLEPETIITANDALSVYENDERRLMEEQQLQNTIFKLIGYFSKKSKPKSKKKKKLNSVYTNVALFRQPDQPGPLSKSKVLQNGKEKIIQMIGGLDKFHLKEFLFTFAIRRLSKEELTHIAERCHYVVSVKITEIISEYYDRKILDCENVYELDEMLDSEHKILLKVVEHIDRNSENKDNFFLADQSFNDTSYSQLNKKFFFHEIIEFHKVSMAFLSTDNHTGKEHELFMNLRSCLEGILLKFPKWKTATRLIRYVYDTLSEHTYQCNRHLYNVRDLNNWGRGEVSPDSNNIGICITKENFEQFFQHILRFRKCQLSDFAEQPLDLSYLNRVLADKLADRLVAFESDKKLLTGKNMVFVFGHKGAGKSTLIQYLLGNESKMRITNSDACVFDDFGDKIGEERSLFPKTTFPDIVKVGATYFVDLPAMADVSSYDNEVEILLTTKDLLENASSVKLMFVTDNSSIKPDKCLQFIQLMVHATKFIENLEKYTYGIMLVVTKVDGNLPPKLLTQNLDTDFKNIEETIATNADFGDNKKMLRLIRILLSKSKTNYARLGWFYRPDKKLHIKNCELLQGGKVQLEKLIDSLHFIKPHKSDFVLTISNKSRIQILSVLVGNYIGDHYTALLSQPDCDLYELEQKMSFLRDSFKAIKLDNTVFDEYSIIDVSNYLFLVFRHSNIDESILQDFVKQTSVENAANVLQIVGNFIKIQTHSRIQMFRHGFDAIFEYFSKVSQFTKFFLNLNKILTNYEIQSKKHECIVYDSNTATIGELFITPSNFKRVLNQMNSHDNFSHNDLAIEDATQCQHIYKLLSITLQASLIATTIGDKKLQVTGHFIMCNDITDDNLADTYELRIFATNAVYIDKPINSHTSLKKIFIVAPVVELRCNITGFADIFIVCRHFHYIDGASQKYLPGLFGTWSSGRNMSELFHCHNVCSNAIINDYKSFFSENIDKHRNNSFQDKKLRLFSQFIEEECMKYMVQQYGNNYSNDSYLLLKCLIKQLQFLEVLFYQSKHVTNRLYWYKELTQQVLTHHSLQGDNFGQKKILHYLYVALATKINSLEYSSEHTLILDSKEYLDSVKASIKSYEKEKVIKSVRAIQHTYKKSMDSKISEGKTFIDQQITGKIENIFYEIENNMGKLFDEISSLQQNTENNKNKLKEKLDSLKETIVMRNIFDTLRGMNKVMCMCGMMGQSLSLVVDSGLNLTEAIVLPFQDINDIPKNELPSCINDALQMNEALMEEMRNQSIESLQTQLTILLESVNSLPAANGRLEDSISSMRNDLESFRMETLDGGMTDKRIATAQLAVNQITHDLSRHLASDGHGQHMMQLNRMNVGIVWAKVMEWEKQNLISEAIESINDDLSKLEQFRKKIHQTMLPAMKNMQAACLNAKKDLSKLSEIALVMKAWQMKGVFNQFRTFSTVFTQGFRMHDRMIDCLQQMEEAMCVTMQVYERIQNYQSRKEVVDYFAKISTAGNRSYDVTEDEVLNQAVMDVSMIIKSNIILDQYNRGLSGFKQWVFPFAKAYLADLQVPSKLDGPEQDLRERCSELVDNAVANIQQIQTRTAEHSSSIMNLRDQCVHKCNFDEHNFKQAFFVWPHEKYSERIKDLLSGKEVTLMADVKEGAEDDAIKFSTVHLTFSARNKQHQSLLNQYLQDTMISMTHSGNSYYRFQEQIYLISTESLKIRYSHNRDIDGKPLITNEVYDKLSKHEPVLSPYTNWKMQITPQKAFKEISWEGVVVDLRTTGFGQFLDNRELASLEVEKNYSLYNYSSSTNGTANLQVLNM